MKGKLKGKIFNFRNIIAVISVLAIIFLSGISIVQYNWKNVKTNLGKASPGLTENANWDPSEINLTPDDIIKEAIDLANNTTGTYPEGCIGFINTVIKLANNKEIGNYPENHPENPEKTTDLKGNCSTWDQSQILGLSVANKIKKYSTSASPDK